MVEYCAVEPLPRQGGVAPRLHRTRFKNVSYWTKVQSSLAWLRISLV
jgi:hypothetical protein